MVIVVIAVVADSDIPNIVMNSEVWSDVYGIWHSMLRIVTDSEVPVPLIEAYCEVIESEVSVTVVKSEISGAVYSGVFSRMCTRCSLWHSEVPTTVIEK